MIKRISTILLLLISVSFAADQSKMVGMKLGVISEASEIKAGSTFTVAIEIKHFDGFHSM